MALIAHPITQLNGSPQYTADNYRKAVNALLTPSDGTAFGTVSGVRAGSPAPLLSISGTTVIVKPHAGVICPWTGVGAYTYALDAQATVNVTDSTGTYKIALVLSDPSQSHGSAPGLTLQSFASSTADSAINGLVLGQIAAGVASDTAPTILQQSVISVPTLARLNSLVAVEGQKARVTSDGTAGNNTDYTYSSGAWVRIARLVTMTHSIIAGGIPSGSEWSTQKTFPAPFSVPPAAWAIATTAGFNCAVSGVTASGCTLKVKSTANTSGAETITLYAYGS